MALSLAHTQTLSSITHSHTSITLHPTRSSDVTSPSGSGRPVLYSTTLTPPFLSPLFVSRLLNNNHTADDVAGVAFRPTRTDRVFLIGLGHFPDSGNGYQDVDFGLYSTSLVRIGRQEALYRRESFFWLHALLHSVMNKPTLFKNVRHGLVILRGVEENRARHNNTRKPSFDTAILPLFSPRATFSFTKWDSFAAILVTMSLVTSSWYAHLQRLQN